MHAGENGTSDKVAAYGSGGHRPSTIERLSVEGKYGLMETSNALERETLRGRARVALTLAVANHLDKSSAALSQLAASITPSDDEMMARYHVAKAIGQLKMRSLGEAWQSFETALARGRAFGDPGLLAGILINYGTALVQDGDVKRAVEILKERLDLSRTIDRPRGIGLLGLAEARLAAGELNVAAALLHELYENQQADFIVMLGAAAAGTHAAALTDDRLLLEMSYDPSLVDLAFARGEQWLIGPLVEAFCSYYESRNLRAEHDTLLARATASLGSLDNSALLGVRIARFGNATQVAIAKGFIERHCDAPSDLMRGYRNLFEGCLQARFGKPDLSEELALSAERSFESAGRPILRAIALKAANLSERSDSLLRACRAARPLVWRWSGNSLRKSSPTQLTAREVHVANLIARGATNRTIAMTLGISERTVHRHCESIFSKLGVYSRKQVSLALLRSEGSPVANATV